MGNISEVDRWGVGVRQRRGSGLGSRVCCWCPSLRVRPFRGGGGGGRRAGQGGGGTV